MAESLLIAGARLLDPASRTDATGFVGVKDGIIAFVGRKAPKEKFSKAPIFLF